MPKLKQATLFSLKNWDQLTTKEILKSKDVLDKNGESEVLILKHLYLLNKKAPTRSVILSTGMDATLRHLEKHSNDSIASCARNLIHQFRLVPKVSEKEKPTETIKPKCLPHGIFTKLVSTKETPVIKKIQPQPRVELKMKSETVSCKNNTDKLSTSVTMPKTANSPCDKESRIDAQKRNVSRLLKNTMLRFTEALGEQEVKLYLGMDEVIVEY